METTETKQKAVRFWGRIQAIQPRLVLYKFEGETSAKSHGWILRIEGTITEGEATPQPGVFTVALGPAAMKQRSLQRGDLVRGDAYPVPLETPDTIADFYRVGVFRVIAPCETVLPSDPPRTDAPLTPDAMESAPRRPLNAPNLLSESGSCFACPYGTVVAVIRLTDPRNLKTGQWKHVPACLGPADCPHYLP